MLLGFSVSGGMLAGFAFEPGLLLIAAGMIVGIRVSSWMLIGSAVSYLVLTPAVMGLPDWTEEGKTFAGEMESVSLDVGFAPGSAGGFSRASSFRPRSCRSRS